MKFMRVKSILGKKYSEGQLDQISNMLRDVGDDHSFPKGVAKSFELYGRDVYKNVYALDKVYAVMNPRWREFQKMREENPLNFSSPLFHGTRHRNVGNILLQSLRLPKLGIYSMFGTAIYLTPDLQKSFSYAHTGFHPTTRDLMTVFACDALLGNIQDEKDSRNMNPKKAAEQGIDSVYAGRDIGTKSFGSARRIIYREYAVYDPKRIFITHLLTFRKVVK